MKKSTYIKIIASVLILGILLYFLSFLDIYSTLKSMNLKYLPWIFFFAFAHFLIGAWNVKVIVSPFAKIPYWRVFRYHTLTWAAGTFVPGRIGEFGLVYFLKDHGILFGEGTAITVLDRLVTLLTLGIFSVAGLFVFLAPTQAISYFLTLVIILGMIFFIVFSKIGRKIIARLLGGFAINFRGFSRTLLSLITKRWKIVLLNFILTFIKWILMTLLVYVLLLSFGVKANFFFVFLANVTTMIISLVPITINGIGLKESAAVLLYSKIGIDPGITLSVYLLTLVLAYAQSIFFIAVFTDKKTKRKLMPNLGSLRPKRKKQAAVEKGTKNAKGLLRKL